MTRPWSRPVGVNDQNGPDYWDYFGERLAEHAGITPGYKILDVGCGSGSSIFPACKRTGSLGYVIGIDICPH
jgi:O-methyltransferase/aklanonic acid methyltransferase